ncbi:hypothetical protein COBT_003000, partial [Conglomerata obtusa]
MQTYLHVFLLLRFYKCKQQYDPTTSKHRSTMIFLEETFIQCIQREKDPRLCLENIKEKEYKKLEIIYAINNKMIILDEPRQVAYKIYIIISDEAFRTGDDLAKNIDSDYVCKIYDILDTSILIVGKSLLLDLKIIAMELIEERFNSVIFYNEIKEHYIKLYGRFNAKNSYNLFLKRFIQRTLKQIIQAVIAFHEKDM